MSEPAGEQGAEPSLDATDTGRLAREVRAGDPRRFDQLYQRLLPRLYVWASLRVPRECGVDDFLQEVWMRALRNLHTESARSHPFRAWILRIAKNCLLEVLRDKMQRGQHLGLGDASSAGGAQQLSDSVSSVAQRLTHDEVLQRFLQHARSLDVEDREIVIGCALEGETCTEVADRLNLSHEAAWKRWQRLREKLREMGWLQRLVLGEP